jgi:hypothetical protein
MPDNRYRSWTDKDAVAHEHGARESTSRGRVATGETPRRRLRGSEVVEAVMAGFVAVVAVALFLVVIVGIAAVAVAVRREDRSYTLVGEAPDRLSRGTRRLNGVGRRDLDPEFLRPVGELVH